MVVFKGTKRQFDNKIITEDVGTTGVLRKLTIYGVTSYTDLENVIIPIRAITNGTNLVTNINVNELGNKRLKVYKGSTAIDPYTVWTTPGQLYEIFYNGTDFILVTMGSSGDSQETNDVELENTIMDINTTITDPDDILDYFDSDETKVADFVTAIMEGKNITLVKTIEDQQEDTKVVDRIKIMSTSLTTDIAEEDVFNIQISFMYGNKLVYQVYTITDWAITKVEVTQFSINIINGNEVNY